MEKHRSHGPLTIGFDAKRIVRNGTGLGSYARTLVNDLAPLCPDDQLRLYVPDLGRDDLRLQVPERDNLSYVLPRHTFSSGNLGKSLWRSKGIVGDLKKDGVGLFHGLSGELPAGLRAAGIPGVVTVHDLIFLRHPKFYPRVDAWLYTLKFHAMLREATRIIAISECTKRDILTYSHFPESRIDLVYQSCGMRFSGKASADEQERVRQKYHLPQRFVLNVGTIEARKNVALAVRALPRLEKDVELVVVGKPTKYAEQVKKTAEKLGVTPRVHLLHGVPNDDLAAIYQLASVFVYPSFYEGFGIPIIEAIQSGLPVVAATGSCLEEAGGRECLYVNPNNANKLAEAIKAFLTNDEMRQRCIARSRQYVTRFENREVASQVLGIYEKTLSSSHK